MIVQLKEMQNALQQQMELFSRMIVAQSENLALFHQKQGSTQLLENAPARNVQDDMDGSEESEYLTPVTLPRFKRVEKKLGYMENHGLPGREREKELPKRVVLKYLPQFRGKNGLTEPEEFLSVFKRAY